MKTTLGIRITIAREALDLSQVELGEEIHAAQSTIAGWEKDKKEPDLATIKKLARALNRAPEWLAFGVNSEMAPGLSALLELNVRAVAGPGGLLEASQEDETAVLATYYFPTAEFRRSFGVDADRVRVLEVIGDSMLGTLNPGEKVLVDFKDTQASPPGIFVVWDGLSLVLKRVEFIPQSDPPRVRISSDNTRYQPYERTIDEAYIQGRVIGSWQRR